MGRAAGESAHDLAGVRSVRPADGGILRRIQWAAVPEVRLLQFRDLPAVRPRLGLRRPPRRALGSGIEMLSVLTAAVHVLWYGPALAV